MWLLTQFQWYRRWRMGRWARCSGLMWGKNWVRLHPESLEPAEEDWG